MKKIVSMVALGAFVFGAPMAMPKLFGGPEVKVTYVNSEQVYMIGLKGGTYVADGYYLGAAGNVLVNDVKVGGTGANAAKNIGFSYAGLLVGNEITDWLEWYLVLGGGNIAKSDAFSFNANFTGGTGAFLGELGANLVLGMTTIGVSYREMTGYTDTAGELTKANFSSINYNIGFKFGNMSSASFKMK